MDESFAHRKIHSVYTFDNVATDLDCLQFSFLSFCRWLSNQTCSAMAQISMMLYILLSFPFLFVSSPPTPLSRVSEPMAVHQAELLLFTSGTAYICFLSVETKETDHKAYYSGSSGKCAVSKPIGTLSDTQTSSLPVSSSCDASHMASRQAAQ